MVKRQHTVNSRHRRLSAFNTLLYSPFNAENGVTVTSQAAR